VGGPNIDDVKPYASTLVPATLPMVANHRVVPSEQQTWERATCADAMRLLIAGKSFITLTTMMTDATTRLIASANERRYRTGLVYVGDQRSATNSEQQSQQQEALTMISEPALNRLSQSSRMVDEFLVYDNTGQHLELIGHSLNGLPREVHPRPLWLDSVLLPGLATTANLREEAMDARRALLNRAHDLERMGLQPTEATNCRLVPDAQSPLSLFFAKQQGEQPLNPVALNQAIGESPVACQAIEDWCARATAIGRLHASTWQ